MRFLFIPLLHSSMTVLIPKCGALSSILCRYKRMGTVPKTKKEKNNVSHKPMQPGQFNKQREKKQVNTILTLRTQCTNMVPVVGHSSKVEAYISMSSHFDRNSSSQKKSLSCSGVASSYIVLLRYCGGPV